MITFVQPNKSFLPGLQAYLRFFTKYRVPFHVVGTDELSHTKTQIEWHFLGTDFRKLRNNNQFIIHEYCSLSIPPFSMLKNYWKKFNNITPDIRIFGNENIQSHLNFTDSIPSFIRDVGVDTSKFKPSNTPVSNEYDFIYVGTIDESRKIHKLLDFFTLAPMNQYKLLVLSKDYQKIEKKYSAFSNIKFEGPVAYDQVPARILASKFAINFIPDVYPFNIQASTKLLEYAACQIPIITTNSEWLRKFENKHGGNFYYFNDLNPYFNMDDLMRFNFSFPNLEVLDWENIIHQSGIIQELMNRFPDLFKDSTLKDIYQ